MKSDEYLTEEEISTMKTVLSTGYLDDTPKTMNLVGVPTLKKLSESMSCLNIQDDVVKSLHICVDKSSPGTKYNIFICCFALNVGCFIEGIDHTEDELHLSNRQHQYTAYNQYYPFLQFVLKQGVNDFPTFEYTCPETDIQTHFENTVIQYIFDTVLSEKADLHNDDILDITEMYKGIIVGEKEEEGEDQKIPLYILCDLTLYQGALNSSFIRDGFIIATVDELMYKQTVFDTPVAQNTHQFFRKYDCVSLLETTSGIEMPYPFQLYMCKRDPSTGKYLNVTKDDPNASSGYLMEHEKYGVGYFFTSEPEFIGTNTIDSLQRYVCFVTDCKYILTEEKETENEKYCSSIYFQEEGIQMWAIKNCLHFTKL